MFSIVRDLGRACNIISNLINFVGFADERSEELDYTSIFTGCRWRISV